MQTWNFFVSKYMRRFEKVLVICSHLFGFLQFFELVMQCDTGLGKIPKLIIDFLSVHQVEF